MNTTDYTKERQQIEREMGAFVKEVLKKHDRIIPVIGDDCYVGYTDNNVQQNVVTIQEWIAKSLLGDIASDEFIYMIHTEGYRGWDLLYEKYTRHIDDVPFFEFKDLIISIVDNGIKNKTLFLRHDVKMFLNTGKFEVVVTTCPYHVLEKEIVYGKNLYNVRSFAPTSISAISKSEATLDIPSIYQIFGDCDGEFVYGEDDLLKFLHYLNQTDTEKGFGASPLVKYIKEKDQDNKGFALLMPIGCNNLPNWLFRFLWYPFSQELLKGPDKNNQGGVWHKHSSDNVFYQFLRKYHFKTFSYPTDCLNEDESNEDPVLQRLTREFTTNEDKLQRFATNTLNVQWNDGDEWDLFISYASEDAKIASDIYDILTNECQKKVWMDTRGGIYWGDEYWDVIQYGIEHSKGFIFIITDNYLKKAIDKNHKYDSGEIKPTGVYQEIDLIRHSFLSKRFDGQKGHSFPIIIDGTKVTFTDNKGEGAHHESEDLNGRLLESLHLYKEYELLQTEALFKNIQSIVCNNNNLQNILINVFS